MRSALLTSLLVFAASPSVALTGVDPNAEPDAEKGIRLPAGFTATVFADGLGAGRQAAVADDGTVYVILRNGELVALKDDDGDGIADRSDRMKTPEDGFGLQVHDGHLYFSGLTQVHRVPLPDDGLLPTAEPELIVSGFTKERQHGTKNFAISPEGDLFVNSGAPSNACQEKMRTPESPGMDPCPILEWYGAIWLFDANKPGQDLKEDGVKFATGQRNAVAIEWSEANAGLYFAQHGRDQLNTLWPDHFNEKQNAELPGEEFHRVDKGDNFGWPYTYYDPIKGKRMVGPEYGGDGEEVSDNPDFKEPLHAFPGHWGPNDLVFYEADAFPEEFKNGAFIAFHGSWNRAPLPQAGYNVSFIPFNDGEVSGQPIVFADGFPGKDPLESPRAAEYRPTGLALGPDGALYIVDSVKGRVWRVTYSG